MEKVEVSYEPINEGLIIPTKGSEMSGGHDLYAYLIEHISDSEVVVKVNIAMQPPPGYMIRIAPRSSFTAYNWVLQNSPALGDADYPGEYVLKFRAIPTGITANADHKKGALGKLILTYDKFPYQNEDRVAQMWLEQVIPIEFINRPLLNHTDREGGFGSTGTK